MRNRRFVKCLNQEFKIYNSPIIAIVLGGLMFALVGAFNGMLWGVGGGVFGYNFGSWLSRQWHLGLLQRKIYWHLPWAKLIIDKNVPESHHRKLM